MLSGMHVFACSVSLKVKPHFSHAERVGYPFTHNNDSKSDNAHVRRNGSRHEKIAEGGDANIKYAKSGCSDIWP